VDDVRAAFRRLVRDLHPDVHSQLARGAAEARFQRVTEAYNTLSDPTVRARYDRARANGRDGVADPRELARALLARAVAVARSGDRAGAEELFRQALAHDESSARAHQHYGSFLLAAGDLKGAVRYLEQAIRLDGMNVAALVDASRALARAKLYSRAFRHARQARDLAPGDPVVEGWWEDLAAEMRKV
jgi:curved DNA-binding protein CbpA